MASRPLTSSQPLLRPTRANGGRRMAFQTGYLLLTLLLLWPTPARAGIAAGTTLTKLLEELRLSGVQVIYSDQLVRPELTIPASIEDALSIETVRTALAHHGLDLVSSSPGVYAVVARTPRSHAIRGRVLEGVASLPIARVRVVLAAPEPRVVLTDNAGAFLFERLEAGTYRLLVEANGWNPWNGEIELVPHVPVLTLEVRLAREERWLEELVVSPDQYDLADPESVDRQRIDARRLSESPLRAGDAFSAIELLPGVAIGSDESAPRIRGSSGSDVSVVVDGLELYEPYHLADFHSPASLLDPDAINDLEFHSGAMPVQYGDRFGGLVRVETPAVLGEVPRSVSLSTVSSRLSAQGRPSRNGFWTGSARLWYPNLIWQTVNVGEDDIDPRLSDGLVKLQFAPSSQTLVSAHVLAGHDRITFVAPEDDETVNARANNRFAWLRIRTSAGASSIWETVVGLGWIDRSRAGFFVDESQNRVEVRDERSVRFLSVTQHYATNIGTRHRFSAGAEARHLRAEYDYRAVARSQSGTRVRDLDLAPTGTSTALYCNDRVQLSQRLILDAGLRWDRQDYTNDQQLSPRLQLAWKLGEQNFLRASLGRYAQSQRVHELEIEDGVTDFARAQHSDQLSVAWQADLPRDLRVRVGTYYRQLTHLRPRYENLFSSLELLPEAERDRVRIPADRARAAGLELGVETTNDQARVSGSFAYTYAVAEDRDRGVWVPRSWDQRHALTGSITFRFRERLQLSFAALARTGWPTTPVAISATLDGSGLTHPEISPRIRNSRRLAGYYRFDARLSYLHRWLLSEMRIDLAVTNLTDRFNPCCVDVMIDQDSGALETELQSWTGFAPVVSATYRF